MQNRILSLQFLFGALIVLIACVAGFLLWTHRYLFDPKPPSRLFGLDELLITQDVIPLWKTSDPFFPAGVDLCTTKCIAIHFGTKEGYLGALATQYIYQYGTSGIAQRTFDYEYENKDELYLLVNDWDYQDINAQQTFFGCHYMAGQVRQACLWAGRYDEYIVEFLTTIVPGEMELANIENVVRAIDTKMATYLGSTLP